MKKIGTILFVLLQTLILQAQNYNDVISDQEINTFMIKTLTFKESYKTTFNKLPKKVFISPIHIGKADWRNLDDKDLSFEKVFEILNTNTNFSDEDLGFMKTQYETIKETTWNFKHEKIKFQKKKGKMQFQYSIPLFNKDKTIAIMWRYIYYGPEHSYSELHLYQVKNGNWEIIELIAGYIS